MDRSEVPRHMAEDFANRAGAAADQLSGDPNKVRPELRTLRLELRAHLLGLVDQTRRSKVYWDDLQESANDLLGNLRQIESRDDSDLSADLAARIKKLGRAVLSCGDGIGPLSVNLTWDLDTRHASECGTAAFSPYKDDFGSLSRLMDRIELGDEIPELVESLRRICNALPEAGASGQSFADIRIRDIGKARDLLEGMSLDPDDDGFGSGGLIADAIDALNSLEDFLNLATC